MTDSRYIHLIIIMDRSGSMDVIREDTEGGLHSAVKNWVDTSGGDKRTVSLYQFDTVHDTVLHFAPLEEALDYRLEPRGGTALLDACGRAIGNEGDSLRDLPEDERPGQVIAIIATDGQENSSKKFRRSEIREMIERQQDRYGWKFTYIGANQDSFAEAGAMGIPLRAAMNYASTMTGTAGGWASVSHSVQNGTASTTSLISYSAEQRSLASR